MSKSIVIPSDQKPFWSCKIGNKEYSYKAGATVTVPDEVAALIEANAAEAPREEEYDLDERVYTAKGWDEAKEYELPAASADAIGGVLMGEAVADATSDTAVTTINALIASLVAAGVIAEYEAPAAGD